jgi:hypothetical protein
MPWMLTTSSVCSVSDNAYSVTRVALRVPNQGSWATSSHSVSGSAALTVMTPLGDQSGPKPSANDS